VIAEADVAKATFDRHLPSKDAPIVARLDRAEARLAAASPPGGGARRAVGLPKREDRHRPAGALPRLREAGHGRGVRRPRAPGPCGGAGREAAAPRRPRRAGEGRGGGRPRRAAVRVFPPIGGVRAAVRMFGPPAPLGEAEAALARRPA